MKTILGFIAAMAVIFYFTWLESPEYRKTQQRQQEEMSRQIWLSCRANSVTADQAAACYALATGR